MRRVTVLQLVSSGSPLFRAESVHELRPGEGSNLPIWARVNEREHRIRVKDLGIGLFGAPTSAGDSSALFGVPGTLHMLLGERVVNEGVHVETWNCHCKQKGGTSTNSH